MNKIAIFQNKPGIGDMCIYLPFIQSIAKYYSQQIYIFTKSRSKSKELLKYDPYIKEIIYTDDKLNFKNYFSMISFIKKFEFDKIFIFSYGFRYPLIFWLSGIKHIFFYGFFKKKNSIFLDAKNSLEKWIGKKNFKIECNLFLKNKKRKIENSCVIGIGGSGPTKKWSIENYANLINHLKNRGFEKFIIAGGQGEKEDFEKLMSLSKNNNFLSLCDKSIEESIEEISRANTYIGNDTGFMHISGMCGLKTYGLFGDSPTNYASYNPIINVIVPEGYTANQIGHYSRAINKITLAKVLKDISL